MAAELTPQSYVNHHLSNLTFSFSTEDFWTIHIDTIFMSVILGIVVLGFFWYVARKVKVENPSKLQVFVELMIETVEDQVAQIYPGDQRFLGPLALTLFFWILIMNAMDLIPIDFFHIFGDYYWKPVPTADLNVTFAMSFTVLFLMIGSAIQAKGIIGFIKELFTSPFHANNFIFIIILALPNLILNIVETLAKPVSLGMRLFGNMYAGEILFLLIWLLASAGIVWMGFAYILGTAWELFHVLIVVLQAFIFAILSVAYIALMRESH